MQPIARLKNYLKRTPILILFSLKFKIQITEPFEFDCDLFVGPFDDLR